VGGALCASACKHMGVALTLATAGLSALAAKLMGYRWPKAPVGRAADTPLIDGLLSTLKTMSLPRSSCDLHGMRRYARLQQGRTELAAPAACHHTPVMDPD
jgi:hypothetical protein